MNNKKTPALLGALALVVAAPASAALYRCGNVFQDRPCEGPVQEAARAGATAPPQRRAASAPAPEAAAPALEAASAPPREEAASVRAPAAASSAASAPRRKGPPSLACGNLREQQHAIDAQLAAGGRPQTIEMYQRQRREVEKGLAEGNC
jgi:hypothetical protein